MLGGFAFVLFAIVFFRLWFLQVLTGEDYVSQARENRVRKVRIEAPRGDIVDRNGRMLVRTRVAPVVQVVPNQLPESVLELADTYREARCEGRGRRGCRPPRACAASTASSARTAAGRRRPSAASAAGWRARRARRARRGPAAARRRRPTCARSTAGSAASSASARTRSTSA